MADQQSTHASLSPAVNIYYEKKILEDFEPKAVFFNAAPIKTAMPKGSGNQVEFTRYRKIAALYSDNTDEFTAQQSYLSAQVINATLHERDSYVQVSRFASLAAIGPVLDQAAKKVQSQAVKTLDKLVRNDIGMCIADVAAASSVNMNNLAIDGGSLNSTGATARIWSHDAATAGDRFPVYHNKTRVAQSATVQSIAKTALTVKTVQHGVSVLTSKDVDTLGDGMFRLIAHPEATYQITTNAGFKGWFSPTSSKEVKMNPSEVGIIAGTKIMHSTLAYKFPLSGDTMSTGSGDMYCSFLFGDEAYGVTEFAGQSNRQGFSFFLKQSGPQTTSDPTNMKKQAAFSITAVAKTLNKSAGLWLLSTRL